MIVVADFGAGLFAVCSLAVIWSFVAGYVPARWPMGRVTRDGNAVLFWLLVGMYTAAGLAGLALAVRFWGL